MPALSEERFAAGINPQDAQRIRDIVWRLLVECSDLAISLAAFSCDREDCPLKERTREIAKLLTDLRAASPRYVPPASVSAGDTISSFTPNPHLAGYQMSSDAPKHSKEDVENEQREG